MLAIALALSLGSAPAPTDPQPVSLSGKIREVSGGPRRVPRALLVTTEGKTWELYGVDDVAQEELARLSGVKVSIDGTQGGPGLRPGAHVRVDRYEILDVGGGVVPELGSLATLEMDGEMRLLFVNQAGVAAVLPEGWGRKLKRHAGAKIWIVGQREGGRFAPKRFAILRAATAGDTR